MKTTQSLTRPTMIGLAVGPFGANCYLLHDGRRAFIVDPGAEPGKIMAALARTGLKVGGYLITHGHVDHIGALADLYAAHPAPISLAAADLSWAFGESNAIPPLYPRPRQPPEIANVIQGDSWGGDAGGEPAFRIIATPGHSPGGICYFFPDARLLFSGDTLFQGTVGRTDLPGGDGRELTRSLKKLAALPAATKIYPGHGPATDLAAELRANPFMQTVNR